MQVLNSYFDSNVYKPFYMVVGDKDYKSLKAKLAEAGDVEFVCLSQYCSEIDKKPDLDRLRETLRMADIDCKSNRIVLLGLGEYLALEGPAFARTILNELISFNLGSAHAVFLLRGVSSLVREMLAGDPRYEGRQVAFSQDCGTDLVFLFSTQDLGMYSQTGFQNALKSIEDGVDESIKVNTNLTFDDSIYPIQIMKNPYQAICKKVDGFQYQYALGTDDNWEYLLNDINKYGSLDEVFSEYRFDLSLMDFYKKATGGTEYRNWLYYLFLLGHSNSVKNTYLRYVLNDSKGAEDFRDKVLNGISSISHTQEGFSKLYEDRKSIVSQYPDSEIAVFVSKNRIDPSESVYKLTDNTLVEREEIIAYIAEYGIPQELSGIYPALYYYLERYSFQGDALSDLLTNYFDAYKQQKVLNKLRPEFLDWVDELATKRVYNRLQTRDEIVAGIETQGTFLRWIDALGVEYLSFIIKKAQERGLAVQVKIGRAELPTITGINKGFYDTWPDDRKRKIEELDELKHKDKGGYKYSPSSKYPIHLAKELDIISDAIDEAATDLALRQYDRYVIASDHGASRLAVLREKEEKYETDTKGEHSGRCCKSFSGYDLPFATEEHGYIVLADYGRFKGSRAANVEVHGGASLEEVVVPVIILSLKDNSIEIRLVESAVKADFKEGITFTMYVNKAIEQDLYIEFDGKRYKGKPTDGNHYQVSIPEIKRACTAPADVYLGEDLVTHIEIKVIGKSASMNTDFDDLF